MFLNEKLTLKLIKENCIRTNLQASNDEDEMLLR